MDFDIRVAVVGMRFAACSMMPDSESLFECLRSEAVMFLVEK
jgi:hypothetical protein